MPHGVNFYEHFGILENGAKSYGYNLKGHHKKRKRANAVVALRITYIKDEKLYNISMVI